MTRLYPPAVLASRRLAAAIATVTVAVGAAGAGCGREPSPSQQVRGALSAFGEATAAKDYQRLCDEILSGRLVARLEGAALPCEVALQAGLGDVRNPVLVVRRIQVRGDRATARVHTSAEGQPPSDDVLALRREGGAWRITSLGGRG
jgi:hypothetical protein